MLNSLYRMLSMSVLSKVRSVREYFLNCDINIHNDFPALLSMFVSWRRYYRARQDLIIFFVVDSSLTVLSFLFTATNCE